MANDEVIDLKPAPPPRRKGRQPPAELGGLRWTGIGEVPGVRRQLQNLAILAVVLGVIGAALSTRAGGTLPAPVRPVGWGFIAAGITACALMFLLRRSPIRVEAYEHGLVIDDGRTARPVQWADIVMVAEQRDILLNAVGQAYGNGHLLRLQTRDGTAYFLELGLAADSDVLSGYLHEGTLEHLLPRAEKELAAGRPVDFGPLRLSPLGLVQGSDLLPWEGMASIDRGTGRLIVLRKRDRAVWFDVPAADVPNLQLLLMLIEAQYYRPDDHGNTPGGSRVSILDRLKLVDGAPRIGF